MNPADTSGRAAVRVRRRTAARGRECAVPGDSVKHGAYDRMAALTAFTS